MTRNQQLLVLGGVLLIAGCCLVTMLGSAGGIVIIPKVLPQIFVVRPTPTPVVIVVTPLYVPPPTEIPPAPLPTTIYAPPAPTTVYAPPAPTSPPTGGSSSWTPEMKCTWLKANFPQTTEGVQALGAQLAAVQPVRVRTHLYPCSPTETVFDGLIILGPNEGYQGAVTMQVPPNGAIDSYVGASFTGRNTQIGQDTIRGFDGTVSGVSMTYWPWDDSNPPVGGTSSVSSVVSGGCIQPSDLATSMGWKNQGLVDPKFGGLQVELLSTSILPPLWEALASGRKIQADDPNREMLATVWTIYPPLDCREALGYSK